LNKNVKTRNIANIKETAEHIAKSSKFQPQAVLLGVLQGIIIGFVVYVKKCFLFKIERYFYGSKMNFGSNFRARVSFHVAILQS